MEDVQESKILKHPVLHVLVVAPALHTGHRTLTWSWRPPGGDLERPTFVPHSEKVPHLPTFYPF